MMYQPGRIALLLVVIFLTMSSALPYAESQLNIFTITPYDYKLSEHIPFLFPSRAYNLKTFVKAVRKGKRLPAVRFAIDCPGNHYKIKRLLNVYQGVKSVPAKRIVIISRGRSPVIELYPWTRWFGRSVSQGSGMRKVRHFLQHDILPKAIFIIFDYIDDPSTAGDFGYAAAQKCLDQIIALVKSKNPRAHITLAGDCRGAHAVLRYVTAHPDDETIDTLILESPYAELSEVLQQISGTKMSPYLGTHAHPIMESIFEWHYPAYKNLAAKQSLSKFPDLLTQIRGKKIFIGHHLNDHVISQKQIDTLVEKLSAQNELYLFTSADKAGHHGYLSPIIPFQQTLNAFCAR